MIQDENENLSEYFIGAQELMSRLTEAGEKKSETLFNALVVNGLPEKYEHFIILESFDPAANFTELQTRLQNFEASRFQRNQAKDSATAMPSGNTSSGNKSPSNVVKTLLVLKQVVVLANQIILSSILVVPIT